MKLDQERIVLEKMMKYQIHLHLPDTSHEHHLSSALIIQHQY